MTALISFLLFSCNAIISYAQIVDPENSELCPRKPPDFSAPWPSCDATALTQDCNYSPGPCMLDPNKTCYMIFCSCLNGELVCAVPSGGGGQVPPLVETEAPITSSPDTMAPVTNPPVTTDYGKPSNDMCEDATSISMLPFVGKGSVTNATLDEWTIPEDCLFVQVRPGKGVWYKLNNAIEPGKKVKATFLGLDAIILEGKDCTPDAFSCVNGTIGRVSDDNSLTYQWTMGNDVESYYFLYIATTRQFPGSNFTVSVDEVLPPTMYPTIYTEQEQGVQPSAPTSASSNRRIAVSQLLQGLLISSFFFAVTTSFG